MKRSKSFLVYVIVILVMLLGVNSTSAQIPPPEPRDLSGGRDHSGVKTSQSVLDEMYFRPDLHRIPNPGNADSLSPQVNLGQPGFSLRHVQTFGVPEEPYLTDATHLYTPAGLFIDPADNVYVVEEYGHRARRYNSTGINTLNIGHPGLPFHHDDFLAFPNEIARDGAGNLWIAIDPAVKVFDSSGNLLGSIPEVDPWMGGSDNDRFYTPRGLAFDSAGRLYVSDEGNHRVQVYEFDITGTPVYSTTIGVTQVSGDDDAHFLFPSQIVIDSNDNLYVMDRGNSRVQRCVYATSWSCTTFHGTGEEGSDPSQLSWAFGLGIDTSDNIWIADGNNGRIKKCTTAGVCTIFATGISWPGDVAVNSTGTVFVSDVAVHAVRRYSSSGVFLGYFASTNGVPYLTDTQHLNMPWGVGVAADGSIYIQENRGHRLVKLNAAGVQQWAIGEPGIAGSDNAHFGDWWGGPMGNPAVDANGRVYAPDAGNCRVQIFNADGTYFATLGVSEDCGSDNARFDNPHGVAISPVNGDIYVVDHSNSRIQVFTSSRAYKATLGVTGVTGDDNQHFYYPRGVATDRNGNIFIADTDNHRVQKCTLGVSSYSCTTFAGETGVYGEDYAHMHPLSVAVDGSGKVYVADEWNTRVLIFDASGALLTVVGQEWSGLMTSSFYGPSGVAVDSLGNVYVADYWSHRVQKYAPGVPRWIQKNINGFGDRSNTTVSALLDFNGELYAGTKNYSGTGAQLWKMGNAGNWANVTLDGFGNPNNNEITDLIEFFGKIYVSTFNSTNGAEVLRSDNGAVWDRVVVSGFGDTANTFIFGMKIFSGQLYAAAWSESEAHGAQIWRSSTGNEGSWQPVVTNGFNDDTGNISATAMEVFENHLYAGTWNTDTGAEVWRSLNGDSWTQVNIDGFGEGADNGSVFGFAVFQGILYASTSNCNNGGQVWRSDNGTSWTKVVDAGFSDINNCTIGGLFVFGDHLYAWTYNHPWNYPWTGMEIWRTVDGTHWEQISPDGLGDSNNKAGFHDNSVATFNNQLFFGTDNFANGGELWQFLDKGIYLPLVTR